MLAQRLTTMNVKLTRNFCSTPPTIVKTFANQDKLPPLPVPSLKDTCDKYLQTVVPITASTLGAFNSFSGQNEMLTSRLGNPALIEKTKQYVADFTKPGGLGEVLQSRLVQRSKEHKNWLEEWWLKYAYLAWPDPIPIYSNYYFMFDEEIAKGISRTEQMYTNGIYS